MSIYQGRTQQIQQKMGNNCATKPQEVSKIQQNAQIPTNQAELQYMNNAKYCEDINDYTRALEFYSLAAQVNPRSSQAYNGVANCHLKMGDFTRAIYFYERGITFDPNSKFCYNGMGVAYQSIQKDELAIKNFNKAIQIDPTYVYPYNGLGNLYYARKKFSEAIPFYESAHRLNPKNPIVLANLACCQSALNQHTEALETFKKAQRVAQSDNVGLTQSNRGYLNSKIKEFQQSISRADAKTQQEFKETNNVSLTVSQAA